MNTGYKTSIKGKIIAIFLVSLAAVISSYFVNKFAFREIRNSVADFSHTNKKLIIVNSVFFEVNESEKSFRNLLTSDSSFRSFNAQSKKLKIYSDSLRKLCAGNKYQVALIDSITGLFSIRQKFLLEYVDFRRKLRNDNPVLVQAKILDSLISIENSQVDSLVYSNEQNQSTTQIDSVALPEEPAKKGFWRKIFKPKKKEAATFNQVTKQEVKTKIDTIVQIKRNSITEEAQKIISAMGSEQRLRRKKFLSKEIALNKFESSFQNRINDLLSEIERDITHQTGVTHYNAEKSINHSIGRVFIIIACFFLLAVIITLLMLGDITKSNRYRKLLELARKDAEWRSLSWQRFLSNMSHEIRTPLQSIIGYSELMKRQKDPDPGYLNTIFSSSEHLLQVINEILDFNKINSGKFSFEQVTFTIRQLVTDTVLILKYLAEQKGLSLIWDERDLPEEGYWTGDPFRLKQILLNLIGNAIKFTDQGTVALKAIVVHNEDKRLVIFKVSDTGSGIPYEMQEVIFDRFEQVRLSKEQSYGGSGLGLSIVKALVEGQGGTISVESTPGKGSCFTFQIEYSVADAPVPEQQGEDKVLYDQSQSVWLIDDDNVILQLCSAIFERHHITYHCFNSAESFLDKVPDWLPSIILVDIRMPDMNGFQLYDEIRKRYTQQIAIFAVTAQALPEERMEIMAHGFDGILLKPFQEEALLSLLQRKGTGSFTGPDGVMNNGRLEPNLSMEENEESKTILHYYAMETSSDISRLQSAVAIKNIDEMTMMLHRIAGRTAQIGEKNLGQTIRKLEISLRNGQDVDQWSIKLAIEDIEAFVQGIEIRLGQN